jgi:hypothetical protein
LERKQELSQSQVIIFLPDVTDPTIVVWKKGWKPLGSYYWNLAPIQESRCIEVASRMGA